MLDTRKHIVQLVLVKATLSPRVLLQNHLTPSLAFSKVSIGVAAANFLYLTHQKAGA